jgi:ubiquinol-cytochrome c reductase cytochrome c1 subunit
MNKELKIFAVVAAFTLALYYGVEPYAHSQMHHHVESQGLVYDGTADIEEASKEKEEAKKVFWGEVKTIAALTGDAAKGEAAFATCAGCHNDAAGDMGGVIPPALDHAGSLYDRNYLIALIKDPALAMNTDHKFADTSMHPMGAIKSMMTDNQQIADVVAYLKAKKNGDVSPREAYVESCGRCHANRYDKWTQVGFIPKTKSNIKTGQDIDNLKFQQEVAVQQGKIADYMGKLPPDLSMISRARSHHFLETFIENPQSQLHGTAMPRVGLSDNGMHKVMEYLEFTGDPSKPAREAAGPWVIGFFILFTILAYLWKQSLWRDLH